MESDLKVNSYESYDSIFSLWESQKQQIFTDKESEDIVNLI